MTCTTSGDTEEEIVWRRFKFTLLNLSETKRIMIDNTNLCTHCKDNTQSAMFSSAGMLLDTLIETLAQNEPKQPEESLNFGKIPIASKQSHRRVPLATARAHLSLNQEPEAYSFQSSYPVNHSILRDDSLQDDHGLQSDQVVYLGMLVDRELSLCPFKPGKEQRNHRIDTDLVNIFPKLYDLRSCQEDITRAVRIVACWMAKNPHDKRDISSNPWYTLLKPGIQI